MEVALDVELPLKVFELPLPDAPSRPFPRDAGAPGDTEPALQDFASHASVFHGATLSVSWRIEDFGTSVVLAPLELDAQRHDGLGARIKLVSPVPILPYCTAIHEGDSDFVVDFVTASGFLNTVLVPRAWLLDPQDLYPRLPQLNIQALSSDLAAPKLLRAISPRLLVLSLVNGALVRLDRDSPLAEHRQLALENHKSTSSGSSGFARFFAISKNKVPGHPSLSVDAIVCIQNVGSRFLVTYSVNHAVCVWSLESNQCVQAIPSHESGNFRIRPSQYVSASGPRVAVAFPQAICSYNFDEATGVLEEDEARRTEIRENLHMWFLTSLCTLHSGAVVASFKLDYSAQIFLIDKQTWTVIKEYDNSRALDLPANSSVAALKARLADYSPSIVRKALSQLSCAKFNPSEGIVQLTEQFLASIDQEEVHTSLLQLDTLCREFKVQATELLSTTPALSTNSGQFFWTLRAASTSLLAVATEESLARADEGRHEEALELARGLLGGLPEAEFENITAALLAPKLVMDRVDNVCDLMRGHVDQLKLNEVGREVGARVSTAIERYNATYGVDGSNSNSAGESTRTAQLVQLSRLGNSAVSSLVTDYASSQAAHFSMITALAVIAFVEGWLVTEKSAEILASSVASLRRFTILSRISAANLQLEIKSVYLEEFGVSLARQLISQSCPIALLARMLSPDHNSRVDAESLVDFERAASFCSPSAELTLLSAFAKLIAGESSAGSALAQQVSLARPWPRILGERPATQAAWFLAVAQYAESVGARDAAFWLAQLGESLSSFKEPCAKILLELLFRLSLDAGDLESAYMALTRRYRGGLTDGESDIEEHLKMLIMCAAQKSEEDLYTVVVSYPFVGLAAPLQRTLANASSFGSVPAYKLRYAWHVEREDFVGAAQVVYNHLRAEDGLEAARKAELYTVCLNALSAAAKDSGWLASGDRVVSFEEIRKEQSLLLAELTSHI